jgi:UDP-glucose 4-epimerase
MTVLICGGAGYIGSHCIRIFAERGEDIVVLDNLETGHREALPAYVKFYHADIRDAKALSQVFEENQIEAVIHFCAYSLVGESVEKPLKYFDNNVGGMIAILQAMQKIWRQPHDFFFECGCIWRSSPCSHPRNRRDKSYKPLW